MTVYVIGHELEKGTISLSDEVYISDTAYNTFGSRMFVEVNSKVKLEDLMYGVIIQSGNDASVALAEHVSGSDISFAALMNQHAENLGMNNTYFVNSSGMPVEGGGNYTTAHDLAILSQALIREHPEIYKLHVIKEYTYGEKKAITQYNRNRLLCLDQSVDGIKTGFLTVEKYSLASSIKYGDRRINSVASGFKTKNSRSRESAKILNWGLRKFDTIQVTNKDEIINSLKVWLGKKSKVDVFPSEDVFLTIPKRKKKTIKAILEYDGPIEAPIKKGDKLGILNIYIEDELEKQIDILSAENIKRSNVFSRILKSLNYLVWGDV